MSVQQNTYTQAKTRAPVPSRPILSALTSLLGKHTLLLAFLALVLLGSFTSEYFLTEANFTNLLRSMAVPAILALGVSFVLLVARIDLSVASQMIFAPVVGVIAITLIADAMDFRVLVRGNSFTGSSLALVSIALITGALVGWVNGVGVMYGRITSFIMTLAMMQGLRGMNYYLTGGHAYYLQSPTYTWTGTTELLGVPFSFLVYVVLSVIAALALRYTIVGRRLYAIGGDEKSAALAGINVRFWVIMAFVICGVMAAIAGILFTSRLQSVDAPLGFGYELNAIAFAVIGGVSLAGGKGSPYRVFLGALVITTLLNILTLWGFGSWYQNLAMGIVVIGVVAIDQWLHRRSRN